MSWRRLLLLDAVVLCFVGGMVAVVLVADGGGGSLVVKRGGGSKPVAVRSCATRIEGGRLRPNPRNDFVAGPVIFYGLRDASRAAVRDPSHAFQSKKREYPPVKIIAEVRATAVVTVSIARSDRGRARLVYRVPFPGGRRAVGLRLEEGQVAVRFEGCPPSQGRYSTPGSVGARTQFGGGFLFTEPQCLRLDVYDTTEKRRRRYVEPYGRPRTRCRTRRHRSSGRRQG
jgi:hypothetical protein